MTMRGASSKAILLDVALVAALVMLAFVLPAYHFGLFPRIMVLAVFAMGYNILFGYTGLLSLGHAMFFSAGLYGAGMTLYHLDWSAPASFAAGIAAGTVVALGVGVLALRTTGVAFMIVTLMFAQIFYLITLYFTDYTRGEEGIVLSHAARRIQLGGGFVDLADPMARYAIALGLFAIVLAVSHAIVRSPFGRTMVAIRENEERLRMLGYNVYANKLAAVVVSGVICSAAGAAYALLFGYVGSSFASIQYSILPLLWVLLGGAATVLGPVLGTFLMYYVSDIASDYTSAYLLVVGVALILLILYFPKGVLGTVRQKWLPWLP